MLMCGADAAFDTMDSSVLLMMETAGFPVKQRGRVVRAFLPNLRALHCWMHA